VRKEFVRQGSRPNSSVGTLRNYNTRAIYIAERTGDGKDPNTLLYCDARIALEHTSKADDVAKPWHEDVVDNARKDGISTADFFVRKRIIHPGEVNRIRTLLQHIVVTHTDSPVLYVWDFSRQDSRGLDQPKHSYNVPDCTLIGHQKNAEYAMSVATLYGDNEAPEKSSGVDPWVASGGSDCTVLVWRLNDYQSMGSKISAHTTLGPGATTSDDISGHTGTVEGVSFCGQDRNLICSGGRDSKMLVWDLRSGIRAISVVREAHAGDVNSVDFGGTDGRMIASGGSDAHVRVWDHRKLVDSGGTGVPVGDFLEHTAQVNSVMWNKFVPNVFASCADDGQVMVWNTALSKRPGAANVASCPELVFRHVGHKLLRQKAAVVDFQWLPDATDPWCIATVSEMIGESLGSILQIWRMSSMISSPREVVAATLRELQNARPL
jgi:histone-binding protein RBBP4